MAAGPFTLFDAFKEKLGNGLIDLDTASFRLTLHGAGYTPSITDHAVLVDTSNELTLAMATRMVALFSRWRGRAVARAAALPVIP